MTYANYYSLICVCQSRILMLLRCHSCIVFAFHAYMYIVPHVFCRYKCFRKVKSKTLRGFLLCVGGYVACRLPETSTLLTYMILDRKGLDFWEWLLLFKRLSTFSQPLFWP